MTLPTFYTPEEIGDRLKVTRRSVYEWLRSGKLRGLRAGQYWRVTEEDLMAFLEGETQKPEPKSGKSKKR